MIIFTTVFLIIDICSKLVVSKYLSTNESIELIKDFLRITHVKNTGVAWSLFNNQTILVLVTSIAIIIGIIIYITKNKPSNIREKIAYSLILGGAMGNLINRIICGYVTDFIDINIFGYNYPIFNLADTFIVIGVIVLIIGSWRYEHARNKSNRK